MDYFKEIRQKYLAYGNSKRSLTIANVAINFGMLTTTYIRTSLQPYSGKPKLGEY